MKFSIKNLKPLDIATLLSAVGAVVVIGKMIASRIHKKINPTGKTFAFMGDSYTALPTYGWQSVMAKNHGFTEVNLAKGGMQTSWMVGKTREYLNGNKPDYFVILGGANDAYSPQTIENAIKNIQTMVDMANEKGVKPIVVTGYNARKVQVGNPRQKPSDWQLRNGITQQTLWDMGEKYYQMQLRMEKDINNAVIVPIWQEAVQADTYDGLHLTAPAHKKMGEYIGNYLFKKES